MATIKAVKTLTLSNGETLVVVSAPPHHGTQSEKIDVTDLTNAARKEFVARPQLEETDINLQCAYAGTLAAVGTAATLRISITDTAGGTNVRDITGFVLSAVPVVVDSGGERRMLQDVVFSSGGSSTTTTTTTTTTST
jgi:hypothetical protein